MTPALLIPKVLDVTTYYARIFHNNDKSDPLLREVDKHIFIITDARGFVTIF